MFGYAGADERLLTEAQKTRYSAVYCGVCRALGEERKKRDRLLLSYDFVLLPLILSALTGESYAANDVRCLPHPFGSHPALFNRYTEYAADLTVLLAYEKILDDVKDEGGAVPRLEASLFRRDAEAVGKKYPELKREIDLRLGEIAHAEKNNVLVPDVPADAFGGLLAAVFLGAPGVNKLDEEVRNRLWRFAFFLGKAIYLMDAAVDFQQDLRRGRYNPFLRSSFDHRKQTLELVLAEAVAALGRLPLGEDAAIVENVLYAGIWRRFVFEEGREKP